MTNNINEGQIWWNIKQNIPVRITNVICWFTKATK